MRIEFGLGQRHHCRAGFGELDAYTLIINKQTSPPQDISSPCVPDLYLSLASGDKVKGAFRVGANAP